MSRRSGPYNDAFAPFQAEGENWRWYMEIVRDVDEKGQDYTWTAFVCGKHSVPRMWTPAYAARSERLKRESRAVGSYSARMRKLGLKATVERIDPLAIYRRDGWICQICHSLVDPSRAWPDMWCATIDHHVPLSAGGEHTLDNVRLAHWICNLRKGDYFPVEN
ncbi:HNH endonuclease [Streptomyces albidoflavus]